MTIHRQNGKIIININHLGDLTIRISWITVLIFLITITIIIGGIIIYRISVWKSNTFESLILKADNYSRSGDYKKAAETYHEAASYKESDPEYYASAICAEALAYYNLGLETDLTDYYKISRALLTNVKKPCLHYEEALAIKSMIYFSTNVPYDNETWLSLIEELEEDIENLDYEKNNVFYNSVMEVVYTALIDYYTNSNTPLLLLESSIVYKIEKYRLSKLSLPSVHTSWEVAEELATTFEFSIDAMRLWDNSSELIKYRVKACQEELGKLEYTADSELAYTMLSRVICKGQIYLDNDGYEVKPESKYNDDTYKRLSYIMSITPFSENNIALIKERFDCVELLICTGKCNTNDGKNMIKAVDQCYDKLSEICTSIDNRVSILYSISFDYFRIFTLFGKDEQHFESGKKAAKEYIDLADPETDGEAIAILSYVYDLKI